MDNRAALKSMLNNLINDRQEEAQLDLHSYLTNKMKSVAGLTSDVAQDEVSIPPQDEEISNQGTDAK